MSVMTDPPKPAFRLSQLIYDTRYRSITIQIIALALIAAGIWWLVNNTIANLNALGKDFDFGFLGNAAGYDINQMLIEYDSQSTHGRAAVVGILNTLLVAFLGCITALVLGEGVHMRNSLIALWLALSVYTGAFIAENVRAGILAVSKGQTEAASALGMQPSRTMRLVVLPQAMRVIIPPLISQFLNLTKNSSLAIAVDTSSQSVSYVRETMLAESAPPVTEIGVVRWVRENLFSSWMNAILTVISIYVVYWILSHVGPWLLGGIWDAGSLSECREIRDKTVGSDHGVACFAVISARWHQLLFGYYPSELYWRPILALIIFLVGLIPVLFAGASRKLLYVSAAAPFVCFWLLWGGSIWLPISAALGFAVGYFAYKPIVAAISPLAGIIAAIVLPLVYWLFAAGPLYGALDSILPIGICFPPPISQRWCAVVSRLCPRGSTKARIALVCRIGSQCS